MYDGATSPLSIRDCQSLSGALQQQGQQMNHVWQRSTALPVHGSDAIKGTVADKVESKPQHVLQDNVNISSSPQQLNIHAPQTYIPTLGKGHKTNALVPRGLVRTSWSSFRPNLGASTRRSL